MQISLAQLNQRMQMEKVLMIFILLSLHHSIPISATQILAKSKLEKCEKTSDSNNINCTRKIALSLAVPSGSSGGEASIVAQVVEVEENSTNKMQTPRIPPVITINKSAVYAQYQLTYIRDVPYKPQEFYVKTRKCDSDADAKIVKICESLKDESGHVMEQTKPICCPCGPRRRIRSSCGNFFGKVLRGKANTAHCLRFPGEWFHIYGIGQRSIGFSVRIEVKVGNRVSEVVVGPENKSATSNDNFMRVNLIGDFEGYTNTPSFEDSYLVIPKQEPVTGPPQQLGTNFSMWMILERVRFTLDGLECNKIGVSYEAFNGQPNFCSTPFWSCLHNQLWNFWDADQNRIMRHQVPQYIVEGRFERINQDPNAGTNSFSIGVTEVLNTNLQIELSADDIEYVFQRSPGKIMSITIPTFEALTQFGIAQVTTKNTGEVEASYSMRFDCAKGINPVEEQFFIMKPNEALTRSFKLYTTTDQAATYVCSAILKDSDFAEVDRAGCQFSTTATILLENGTLITGFEPPKTHDGFFDPIKRILKKIWEAVIDFITGRSCRAKCLGVFDFSCHVQYICLIWIVFVFLLIAIVPAGMILVWLLHQKGLFDFVYDWWDENRFDHSYRHGHYRDEEMRRHRHVSRRKRSSHREHEHLNGDPDYYYHLHHVRKDKFKHRHGKDLDLQNVVLVEDEHGDRHRSSKRHGTRHVGKKRHHHRSHSH